MKVGDKVKVIDKKSAYFGKVGEIVDFFHYVEFSSLKNIVSPIVSFGLDFMRTAFPERDLELVEEAKPPVYHLDLSLEDMNALAELGKMKDNLELLERLLKRAKGEE